MIVEFLADGFEEVEALTPYDMLKRAGANIKTFSITDTCSVKGSHGIKIEADDVISNLPAPSDIEMVILPGGMPGSKNLYACSKVIETIEAVNKNGGHIGAICAAPFILGKMGLMNGKKGTCYPGFEKELIGCETIKTFDGGKVVTDKNITTASGMGVALLFGAELISVLFGLDKADSILSSVMCP